MDGKTGTGTLNSNVKYKRQLPPSTPKIPDERTKLSACLKIQKTLRGHLTRKRIKNLHSKATVIQACFRGHNSRHKSRKYLDLWKLQRNIDNQININRKKLLLKEEQKQQFSILSSTRIRQIENERKEICASIIQRVWRGSRGRIYVKDYKAKKLLGIFLKNDLP